MNLCVGLTGGIGCGKSTVAKLFAEYGAGIVDTDLIAHHLTQTDGDAIPAIQAEFGCDYIAEDGSLDRSKMRKLIFSENVAKQKLEQLLHPMILERTRIQLQQQRSKPYTIVIVPLLPENPAFQQLVQRVLVVDCSADKQIERVTRRSGMTATEVRAIIAQQTVRAVRLGMADDVINNDGKFDNLARQVAILHEQYSG